MMPVEVSATDRAASFTETLPVRRPVDESISNSPMLDFPASIHITPFACGGVTDTRLPGALRMRCGTMDTAAAPFAFAEGLFPEQAARASAAAVSPMTAVVRRAALAISGFPSNSRDMGNRDEGYRGVQAGADMSRGR